MQNAFRLRNASNKKELLEKPRIYLKRFILASERLPTNMNAKNYIDKLCEVNT